MGFGVGIYLVAFDVTGPGLAPVFPIFTVTQTLAGGTARVASFGWRASSGAMTSFNASIHTYDAAGNLADAGLFLMATLPDADSGSPVPPLVPDRDGAVQCTTAGQTTTCTFTPR